MVSRFGNDQLYRIESAKLLATLLLTMRGAPCIYQGSEIGMTNVAFETLEEYDDLEVVNLHQEWKAMGKDTAPLLKAVQQQGRDNARTPMQWDDSPNAGFTTGQPWLQLNPNYTEINVKAALADKNSIFHFYKKLLAYRKAHKTLIYGDLTFFSIEAEDFFAYQRKDDNDDFFILLNFTNTPLKIDMPVSIEDYNLVISNYGPEPDEYLLPWEARVYRKA